MVVGLMQITFLLHWLWTCLRKFLINIMPSHWEASVRETFRGYGVKIDGDRPCDIRVHDRRFFTEVAHDVRMGLGESYMKQFWSPNNFPAFFDAILQNGDEIFKGQVELWPARLSTVFHALTWNLVTVKRPMPAVALNKDMWQAFLGSSMNFSCGYWNDASSLEEAQTNKMELIARKLKLNPGMTILDIGCGWGTLAKYLAQKHGARIVGCTLHEQQAEYARAACAGLYVDIQVIYCEKIQGHFDRIISVGRFGLIGRSHHRRFFEFVSRCLNDDGIFLLDTIGVNHPNVALSDAWAQKYLFPGLEYPYHTDIPFATDGLFILEDWSNFGFHYSKTLEAWLQNLEQPKLEVMFGSEFYRMWRYYLHKQASAFRLRKLQHWQIVFSKNGYPGGYEMVR